MKHSLSYKILVLIIGTLLLLFVNTPNAPTEIPINNDLHKINSITDGDTLRIEINGDSKPVRLIAVNTPELHHPSKPVECFGKEAKAFLENLLKDKRVKLEIEPKDSDTDKYGRLLRYLFLEDGTNVNETIIKNGYGYEATYVEGYKYQKEFKAAQKHAEENKLGLWAESTCNGKLTPAANIKTPTDVLE